MRSPATERDHAPPVGQTDFTVPRGVQGSGRQSCDDLGSTVLSDR